MLTENINHNISIITIQKQANLYEIGIRDNAKYVLTIGATIIIIDNTE